MTKLTVNTARPYDIMIDRGLLEKAGALSRGVNAGERALIVTDSNVAPFYASRVVASFDAAGYQADVFIFPAGEESKRLTTISEIYARLAKNRLTRGDLLVALGGGVTGDMTGFAAATWLRGIDFVQIPTTLLAQVDSSVGGKTGVDIPDGKNLVGAFWQPVLVLADTDTLDTLPREVLTDGMAEVIKTAAIKDLCLFEMLENRDMDGANREPIISRCIDIKRGVVERDERESGERKLLNFGHTLGHALEKHYRYTGLTHGFGVAVGMAAVTAASEKQGLTAVGTASRLAALLKKYQLPISDPAPQSEYLSAVLLDKKMAGSKIDIVLLREIGNAFVHPMEVTLLSSFLNSQSEAIT
jgi:3-dehydroquinate synthase